MKFHCAAGARQRKRTLCESGALALMKLVRAVRVSLSHVFAAKPVWLEL
jgi:hypothetical protein